MKINRQGNTYTIIYSAVIVLVVGIVLSMVYQALRPEQLDNIANDTKRQILAAVHVTPQNNAEIPALYEKTITDSYIVNYRGDKVETSQEAFDINVADEVKKPDN